jgi:hypothetical protein
MAADDHARATTPTTTGGYIGAGVLKEYSQEYGLAISASTVKAAIPRAWTANDLPNLGDAGRTRRTAPTLHSWHITTSDHGSSRAPSDPTTSLSDSVFNIGEVEENEEGTDTPASAPSNLQGEGRHREHDYNASGLVGSLPIVNAPRKVLSNSALHSTASQLSKQFPSKSSLEPGAVESAVGLPVCIPVDAVRNKAIVRTPTVSTVQAALRREGKVVLAMVGLPARGKTFTARRLKRHLSWLGYKTEIFNGTQDNLSQSADAFNSLFPPCSGQLPETNVRSNATR